MKLLQRINEIEVHHQRTYIVIVNDKKIQVYPEDTSKGTINWYKADEQCRALPGRGWRLPTIEELEAMHKQLYVKGKGNFKSGFYWSSSQRSYGPVLTMSFDKDFTSDFYKENDFLQVRPVRHI